LTGEEVEKYADEQVEKRKELMEKMSGKKSHAD
jgi:hypothetical protein